MTILETFRTVINDNPIRLWREKYGVGFNEMAALLRVTTSTLTKWERGAKPNEENMTKLASLFDVSVDEMNYIWDQWVETLPKF